MGQRVQPLMLHRITEENGLSDNHVRCIYKDKNDVVWIGTLTGLNRMDGSTITSFKHDEENKNSISNNNVTSLTGDASGLIWIGTQDGLNSLDPFTEKFSLYHLPKNILGNEQFINCITADKNNIIFIGTPKGLFYFKNKKITPVILPANKNDLQKNNWVTGLTISPVGILWIITYNGLWSYNLHSQKIIHEVSKINDPDFSGLLTTVTTDHEGKLWMGTWGKGLKKFDPATKKITTYSFDKNISSIAETKQSDGNYLIFINGSLTAFDPLQNKFLHFPAPGNFNSSSIISNMYTSPDGWLWIGSDDGLYIYNPSKSLFLQKKFSSPITSQGVAMLEWNNQLLVSGYGDNFLKAYDENLSVTNDYSNKKITKNLSCLSLKPAGEESIKAGTNDGIVDINFHTHTTQLHTLNFLAKDFVAGNFITSIFQDKNKDWWIFPWRNGIWITDSSYHHFHKVFSHFINEGGAPKQLVIADAVEDKNENLWFADYDEGIIFYNSSSKKFSKPFSKRLGEKYSCVQILYRDNYCYTFLDEAIYTWHCDSAVLHKIELPSQMDKPITSIAIDSAGYIWLATRQGLMVYNAAKNTFDHFTTADGLVKNDMEGSLLCLKNGNMFFGSPDYLMKFNPQKVLHSIGDAPKIILTHFIANGKNIFFTPGDKSQFDHSVNNFVFKWAVTDYNDPLNNNYYYQLKGIDTNWRYAGNRGEVEFANLSPGDYDLVLKGANANRVYAQKTLNIHFEINPPFWRTWWFLFLCIFISMLIFYGIYRYRLYEVLKIQKLRNKISLDLHDDIGSTLSSISILSEMALRQKKENQSAEMLHEIKENSISLMERMDDIVWSINPKNDSLENLFIRIKDFASRLFEAKEIKYHIDISDHTREVHLSMEYRQHIYLIMKESINNLVKYSSATEAEILVHKNHSHLNIIIKDNGTGFDTHSQTNGNGLFSMKKRAEQMNATFDISSQYHKGTAVSLVVKIK
jgi:ligand-binding sensor domain-containing protein/two-component sensor histidine kinase